MYAEDPGETIKEPGFIVVKKFEESEAGEDSVNEAAGKEWEVSTLKYFPVTLTYKCLLVTLSYTCSIFVE